MTLYDKTGDVNIKIEIGSIAFNLLLTRSFFNPGTSRTSINHNHSLYEVHFLDSGSEELLVSEEKTLLEPGTYFLVGPGVYHAHKFTEDGQPLRTYCLRFSADRAGTDESGAFVGESAEILRLLSQLKHFYASDTYGCIALIREIHREFDERQLCYYSRIQSLFVQLLVNLLRTVSSEKPSKFGLRVRTQEERRNEIIEHFFADRYPAVAEPGSLAVELNVSHSQMNRILKKLYGLSFKQKLLETRIEIAKVLLTADETPVHIIAEKVGYSDASCFCSIFKSRAGVSPSQYRSMHKKANTNSSSRAV